jgi:hypothetical protein
MIDGDTYFLRRAFKGTRGAVTLFIGAWPSP